MPVERTPAAVDTLRAHAAAGRLYAVLDACDTPEVLERVAERGEGSAVCLYDGTAHEMYAAFAPYLVRIDGEWLEWIRETLWGEPWGIFALAEVEPEAMRMHFERFLVVRSPDGEEWYFRFYDPRVLDAFLPTCDEAQLAELFGPVGAYAVAEPEAGEVSLLRRVSREFPGADTPPPEAEPAPAREPQRPTAAGQIRASIHRRDGR